MSSSNSRPSVPWPAMTTGSSYGWQNVHPVAAARALAASTASANDAPPSLTVAPYATHASILPIDAPAGTKISQPRPRVLGREGDRLGVVAGAPRRHTVDTGTTCAGSQRRHLVHRPADLERPGALQVLRLQAPPNRRRSPTASPTTPPACAWRRSATVSRARRIASRSTPSTVVMAPNGTPTAAPIPSREVSASPTAPKLPGDRVGVYGSGACSWCRRSTSAPWFGGDPAARIEVARRLDEACRSIGFLQVVGHGVPRRRDRRHAAGHVGVLRPAARREAEMRAARPDHQPWVRRLEDRGARLQPGPAGAARSRSRRSTSAMTTVADDPTRCTRPSGTACSPRTSWPERAGVAAAGAGRRTSRPSARWRCTLTDVFARRARAARTGWFRPFVDRSTTTMRVNNYERRADDGDPLSWSASGWAPTPTTASSPCCTPTRCRGSRSWVPTVSGTTSSPTVARCSSTSAT